MAKNKSVQNELKKLVLMEDTNNCRDTLSKVETILEGDYIVLSNQDLCIFKELLKRYIAQKESEIVELDAKSTKSKPNKSKSVTHKSNKEESMADVLDDFLKNE